MIWQDWESSPLFQVPWLLFSPLPSPESWYKNNNAKRRAPSAIIQPAADSLQLAEKSSNADQELLLAAS